MANESELETQEDAHKKCCQLHLYMTANRDCKVLSQDFFAVDIIDRSCARRLQSVSARSGVSLPNNRDDSLASA